MKYKKKLKKELIRYKDLSKKNRLVEKYAEKYIKRYSLLVSPITKITNLIFRFSYIRSEKEYIEYL